MCPRVRRLTSPASNAVHVELQQFEHTGVERMAITRREELKSSTYARNRWIPKNNDGKSVYASAVVRQTRQRLLTPTQQTENRLTSMSSPPPMARKPLPKIDLVIQLLGSIKTTSEPIPQQLDWDEKANCFYPDDIVTRAIIESRPTADPLPNIGKLMGWCFRIKAAASAAREVNHNKPFGVAFATEIAVDRATIDAPNFVAASAGYFADAGVKVGVDTAAQAAANLHLNVLETQVGMRHYSNAIELGDLVDTSEFGQLGPLCRDRRPGLWSNTIDEGYPSFAVYVAPETANTVTIRNLFLLLSSLYEDCKGSGLKKISHEQRMPVGVEVSV